MTHSDFNTISYNTIVNNNDSGLFLECSNETEITSNTISEHWLGVYLLLSNDISIRQNNFVKNMKDALFNTSKKNTWDQNYWNRPRILPKLIFGQLMVGSFEMSWINIDWHPALKPYDTLGGS
jgi:parallel beta-helix repeat protein